MSCTNNSVISAVFGGSAGDATSGRRLSFTMGVTATTWDETIVAGDVIRYDVDESKYVKSVADPSYDGSLDLSNSEVVGIVESLSLSQTDGITYATVVTHGLMNYPGLQIDGSLGGAGGTDIYFLSPTVPGGITFSIEEQRGHIVKPVLQVSPVSGTVYNSIVINYLGYESSETETSTLRIGESTIGDIKIVDVNAEIPSGWIDTSSPSYLSVSEYQQAYSTYGTKYGSLEQITVNGTSSFVSALAGTSIRPINPNTGKSTAAYAKVISVDTNNNRVVIEHASNQKVLWSSQYTVYEISQTVLGTNKVAVTGGSVTHFKPPKITTNLEAKVGTENQILPFQTKTLLRVKRDTGSAYLPQSISFTDVEINGVVSTQNVANVDSKLVELETRIAALEQKLGI